MIRHFLSLLHPSPPGPRHFLLDRFFSLAFIISYFKVFQSIVYWELFLSLSDTPFFIYPSLISSTPLSSSSVSFFLPRFFLSFRISKFSKCSVYHQLTAFLSLSDTPLLSLPYLLHSLVRLYCIILSQLPFIVLTRPIDIRTIIFIHHRFVVSNHSVHSACIPL